MYGDQPGEFVCGSWSLKGLSLKSDQHLSDSDPDHPKGTCP